MYIVYALLCYRQHNPETIPLNLPVALSIVLIEYTERLLRLLPLSSGNVVSLLPYMNNHNHCV